MKTWWTCLQCLRHEFDDSPQINKVSAKYGFTICNCHIKPRLWHRFMTHKVHIISFYIIGQEYLVWCGNDSIIESLSAESSVILTHCYFYGDEVTELKLFSFLFIGKSPVLLSVLNRNFGRITATKWIYEPLLGCIFISLF